MRRRRPHISSDVWENAFKEAKLVFSANYATWAYEAHKLQMSIRWQCIDIPHIGYGPDASVNLCGNLAESQMADGAHKAGDGHLLDR